MTRRPLSRAPLLALVLALALAACARDDRSSDDSRHGTFYGGVSGAYTR